MDKKKNKRIYRFDVKTEPLPQASFKIVRSTNYVIRKVSEYKKLVAFVVQQHIKEVTEKPIKMMIEFYRSDQRRVDLDNLLRPILNALKGVVWKDDSQIFELTAIKDVDKENPRLRFWIEVEKD